MGNVFAASGPPGGFSAPDPPPPPGLGPESYSKSSREEWPHPGIMEDLHKRTKGSIFNTSRNRIL